MRTDAIAEETLEVEGLEVFCRRVSGDGVPTVFVHGNPTHSEDWVPFLARMRGPAVALDLPGWGRSERPRHGYPMPAMASFFERFLAAAGVERHKLVVHDWGAMALIGAQRHPEQLQRLAIINAVPLLAGYRWHWIARIWRRRLLGELLNASTTRSGTSLVLRLARGDRSAMPASLVDSIWTHFDRQTRRAILTLYRSAPEPALAAAGAALGRIECPTLVVWGGRDPYLPARFGRLYAERIPNAELLAIPDAGHWPWLDDERIIGRVVGFLEDS